MSDIFSKYFSKKLQKRSFVILVLALCLEYFLLCHLVFLEQTSSFMKQKLNRRLFEASLAFKSDSKYFSI